MTRGTERAFEELERSRADRARRRAVRGSVKPLLFKHPEGLILLGCGYNTRRCRSIALGVIEPAVGFRLAQTHGQKADRFTNAPGRQAQAYYYCDDGVWRWSAVRGYRRRGRAVVHDRHSSFGKVWTLGLLAAEPMVVECRGCLGQNILDFSIDRRHE